MEEHAAALILIDVINDLEFPEGDALLEQALPMAAQVASLKREASRRGVPVIYVNDNFGHWRSDFRAQVEHCLHDSVRGGRIARLVAPEADDYFVLKPMHSGFYGTALELLLKHLNVRRLILCGMATNICVLFTASDAYMRGFELWAPADCVAANTRELSDHALHILRTVLKADTRPTTERDFDAWPNPGRNIAGNDNLLRES